MSLERNWDFRSLEPFLPPGRGDGYHGPYFQKTFSVCLWDVREAILLSENALPVRVLQGYDFMWPSDNWTFPPAKYSVFTELTANCPALRTITCVFSQGNRRILPWEKPLRDLQTTLSLNVKPKSLSLKGSGQGNLEWKQIGELASEAARIDCLQVSFGLGSLMRAGRMSSKGWN